MSFLHHSDPEAKAELEARKRLRDIEWLKGQIGDEVYLASLKCCGIPRKDAVTELNLLKLEKTK